MGELKKSQLRRILERFDQTRVLVVGDLILDQFIWGDAQRISPEAPVPVVWVRSQSYMPGGASNVANNIASLGGKVALAGVVGADANGRLLAERLRERGVDCAGILALEDRQTTLKTRIIAAHQQVVRVDWENVERLTAQAVKDLVDFVRSRIDDVDGIVIEDYGKGVVNPALLKGVIAVARRHRKIITVDPKIEHFSLYKGVTALTPNEKEAAAGSGVKITDEASVDEAGRRLLKKLRCDGVLITLGEKGMKLFRGPRITHIPTVAQEVFDVSGAGDTVISVFTLALACGLKMEEAARIANVAAGIVVGKVGVAVVTKEEILEAWVRLGKRS